MNDYCYCGLAEEDPMHRSWHAIYEHNKFVMGEEITRRYGKFEKDYRHEWERSYDPAEQMSIEEPPF